MGRAVGRPEGLGCQRCGHASGAHDHYRRGTDCSLCACPAFRRAAPVWARWLAHRVRSA